MVRLSVRHTNVMALAILASIGAVSLLNVSSSVNVGRSLIHEAALEVRCATNSTRITRVTKAYPTLEVDAVYAARTLGVFQVYLDIFAKAKKLATDDFPSINFRGQRGVLIGPIAGKFLHTTKALQNARRIRSILAYNSTVKIAIMLSSELKSSLDNCPSNSDPENADTCRMWNGGALFDDVIVMQEDIPYKSNEATAFDSASISGKYWMQALSGYLLAPYVETLFLDSDARPCPGFEKLFSFLHPFTDKLWALPLTKTVDLAVGLDQYRDSGFPGTHYWCPGDARVLSDFAQYAERNTGTVLLNFHSILTRQFAHFVPLVAEHIYNNVATPIKSVTNDQVPFLVAVYLFRRLEPEFNEQILPLHASCRTYAGVESTGIDGDQNGMFPIMEYGDRCRACSCTPCLITHGTAITIEGGKMGWEDDFEFSHSW
ncbi:hypothetical protein MHU86_7252 [Fragilaria crotonensis]|nr:hypothetical protein MHU86_7252 [Fragilaria crotonensis]